MLTFSMFIFKMVNEKDEVILARKRVMLKRNIRNKCKIKIDSNMTTESLEQLNNFLEKANKNE